MPCVRGIPERASSENSMGFHAPQETARILGNAANLARQGQIKAIQWKEEKEP
ncbi:MAG: ammonia-forming cytochrome c nitrite reductase subunit c552 [Opitutales bacterium]